MFFILSKTLYYLVLPLTIITICLALSLIVKGKRWKKYLQWITLILVLIFSNNFLGNTLLRQWELDPIPFDSINREYTYGVVLTGVLQNEQKPKDRPYFSKGADRVFHTFQLYKKGLIKKIIVSGGVGRLVEVDYLEALNMKEAFLILGVPEEDLIVESNSRNTAESGINVGTLLKEKRATDDFILITSAFHMRRSIGVFEKSLKVPVAYFPVDIYSDAYDTFDHYFLPSLDGMQKWERLIQEVTGYIAYDIVGYI